MIIITFFIFKIKSSDNSPRYAKVLKHYSKHKSDSLKLKAAEFLIDNMKEFVSSKTNDSDFYNDFSLKVGALSDSITNDLNEKGKKRVHKDLYYEKITAIWNSMQKKYGIDKRIVEKQLDISIVTSEMLIENIDLAFKVWRLPWAKNLSFDDFCEFVLPYRGFGEPVDNWRKQYYKRNSWVIDSMEGSKDRIKASELVNDELESWFVGNRFFMKYPGGQSPIMLLKSKMGKCVDQVNLAIYSMRSVGLPVTMDYTPLYGNFKTGHTWNTLLLENGTTLNFQGTEARDIGAKQLFPYKLSKVYRKTFAENKESLANKISNYKDIPPRLRSKHFVDVSADYSHVFKTKTLRLDVSANNKNETKEKYAYLCTFNNSTWEAITWAKIKDGAVSFENVGVDIVYLLAYYKSGEYTFVDSPFILSEKEELKYLTPEEDSIQTIKLERKFPLSKRMKSMLWRLKKGRFQEKQPQL